MRVLRIKKMLESKARDPGLETDLLHEFSFLLVNSLQGVFQVKGRRESGALKRSVGCNRI